MVDINWISHAYPVQMFSRNCEMPYRRSCLHYSNVISGISPQKFADSKQPASPLYIST